MAGGRPTKYDDELSYKICEIISTSNKSLRTICSEDGMPAVSTILKWITEIPEFSIRYARAKEEQADFLAEEIIEIADDSSQDLERIDDYGNRIENKEFVNRSRLRVDARKWVASKLKPKRYGDKIEHSGEVNTHTQLIIQGQKFSDENNAG
jgi:hypothetical protein